MEGDFANLTCPVTGACPAAHVHGGTSARVRVDRGVRRQGSHAGPPNTMKAMPIAMATRPAASAFLPVR